MNLYVCADSGRCFNPCRAMQQHCTHCQPSPTAKRKALAYLDINPLNVRPHLENLSREAIGQSNAKLWYLAENSALMVACNTDALLRMFREQMDLGPVVSPTQALTTILLQHQKSHADDMITCQTVMNPGLFECRAA